MSRKTRRLPGLLTVQAEFVACLTVLAVTGGIFWASGFAVSVVKDWVQIAFWVTASLLAWLTYINARRGVLQPLRTEVFRSQLDALKNVQSLFIAKSELELQSAIGLDEMVRRNAERLLGDYAKVFFAQCYQKTRMEVGDGWKPLVPGVAREIQDSKWLAAERTTGEERIAFWKRYSVPGLEIPRSHTEGCEKIRQVLQHPLLPSSVRESIQEYLRLISRNIDTLTTVLNRCAIELPRRYDTFASIDRVKDGVDGPSWIWNAFFAELPQNQGCSYLHHCADNVLLSVRDYLQVETLQSA